MCSGRALAIWYAISAGVRQLVSTARSAARIIHTRDDRYSARWLRRQADGQDRAGDRVGVVRATLDKVTVTGRRYTISDRKFLVNRRLAESLLLSRSVLPCPVRNPVDHQAQVT